MTDKENQIHELSLSFAFGEYFSWTPFVDTDIDMTHEEYLQKYVDHALPDDWIPVPWEPFEAYDEEWMDSEIRVLAYSFRQFLKEARDLSQSAEKQQMQKHVSALQALINSIN